MENTLLVGLSRQMALQRELDVVANNIANLNTTGFKADGSLFEEYLMPVARADAFQRRRPPPELRARPRAPGTTSRQGTDPADRQSARRRDRRQRLPRRADAARRALHPQRRACRSTPRASSSPATATRCSATTARSCSSRPTATSRSAATARITVREGANTRPNRCAASCGSSASPTPQQLQKDGANTVRRAGRRRAAAATPTVARRPGRRSRSRTSTPCSR